MCCGLVLLFIATGSVNKTGWNNVTTLLPGPATLQKIKTQGFACVNCQTTTTQTAQTTTATDQTNNPTTTTADITQTPDTQSPTPTTAITYPTGVYINEILPNPTGADELNEWIVPTIQQIALAYL